MLIFYYHFFLGIKWRMDFSLEKIQTTPIENMTIENIISTLRHENYCLVTDDDGDDPQYDEHGNLLVCKPDSKSNLVFINYNFFV